MATPGSATKGPASKKKGTTIHLTNFLKADVSNWADEDDDEQMPTLPTAPGGGASAPGSHGGRPVMPDPDLSRLPAVAPFKIFVGNLDYTVTAQELGNYFFDQYQVVDVLLLKHDDGSVKGAFVEFESQADLRGALTHNNKIFKNRPLRVDVAAERPNRDFQRQGYDNRGNRGYEDNRRGAYGDRGGFGSGFGDRGGFNDRGPPGNQGHPDRSRGGFDGGYNDRGARDRGGFSRAPDEDMDAPKWGHKHAPPPRQKLPAEAVEPSPPVERKKLVLAPRSKSATETSTASADQPADIPKKASPFGDAKPVDASARIKELEEKLAKQKAEEAAARAKEKEEALAKAKAQEEEAARQEAARLKDLEDTAAKAKGQEAAAKAAAEAKAQATAHADARQRQGNTREGTAEGNLPTASPDAPQPAERSVGPGLSGAPPQLLARPPNGQLRAPADSQPNRSEGGRGYDSGRGDGRGRGHEGGHDGGRGGFRGGQGYPPGPHDGGRGHDGYGRGRRGRGRDGGRGRHGEQAPARGPGAPTHQEEVHPQQRQGTAPAVAPQSIQQRPPNAPQQRPTHVPQQRPPNAPQQWPTHAPQQRLPNAPQQWPTHAPQQRPPNAPQQRPPNAPQQRPPNAPQQRQQRPAGVSDSLLQGPPPGFQGSQPQSSNNGFQEAVDKRSKGRTRGWETHTPAYAAQAKPKIPQTAAEPPNPDKEASKITNRFNLLDTEA